MKQQSFKKVAVLGAGVMGAQIAAHLVNARVPVLLLDLAATAADRNAGVRKSVANLARMTPSPIGSKSDLAHIEVGNFSDDLPKLAHCDLVIEVVSEKLEIKTELYQSLVPHLAEGAILATNTSGLSIAKLSAVLPAELQHRFCGIHFFNPPRYLQLVELIAGPSTNAGVLDHVEIFLSTTLGKTVVRAADTPNFIANRLGVFTMLATMHHAGRLSIPCDVVDDLTGTKLGRAKSATFRTMDVAGVDVMAHTIATQKAGLVDDPFRSLFELPVVMRVLLERGHVGQKAGAGFYRKQGKELMVLDRQTLEYVPAGGKAAAAVAEILKDRDPARQLAALRASQHPQAQFLWALQRDIWQYCACQLESLGCTARDVDVAVRYGFASKQGPFETWQAAGWTQVAEWINADIASGVATFDTPLPSWVVDGRTGVHNSTGSYSAAAKADLPARVSSTTLRARGATRLLGETPESAGTTVYADSAIRLWHEDDGILVASILSKMHAIGPEVLAGLLRGVRLAESEYRAMVIWSPDEPFSVGADIKAMMPAFMSGDPNKMEAQIAEFQRTMMAVKFAQVPVVAAVAGMALGGGCELALHCARRVAHFESYIGLPEVGVGMVPAGGGLKEAALRAAARANGSGDLLGALKTAFESAATAKVSMSAIEARELGYLQPEDVILMQRTDLLFAARNVASSLAESGWRPPFPVRFPVAGRAGAATVRGQLVNMRDGGFISAHDYDLGYAIADILCGGNVDAGTLVDEEWLLELERKAFVAFLQNPKSQERMMGMMTSGKPVRN